MNDLRKAAEMALEALEAHADIGIKSDKAVKALRQALDLQTAIEKGTKAWADVPNASQWVDKLRGNDKPAVKSYCGGKPNYCTPEETPEVTTEVPCKTHPDAPHGFNRNASFDEDRYVCDCEFWEPPEETFILDRGCYERGCVAYDERDVDAVNMSEERVHKTDKSVHEPVAWMYEWNGTTHFTTTDQSFVEKAHPHFNKSTPLYTAPPKRDSSSWVGLTDEEIYDYADEFLYQHGSNYGIRSFGKAIEAKLKEKNNG
jgi:hypothetical protein